MGCRVNPLYWGGGGGGGGEGEGKIMGIFWNYTIPPGSKGQQVYQS